MIIIFSDSSFTKYGHNYASARKIPSQNWLLVGEVQHSHHQLGSDGDILKIKVCFIFSMKPGCSITLYKRNYTIADSTSKTSFSTPCTIWSDAHLPINWNKFTFHSLILLTSVAMFQLETCSGQFQCCKHKASEACPHVPLSDWTGPEKSS